MKRSISVLVVLSLIIASVFCGCSEKNSNLVIELDENPSTGYVWSYVFDNDGILTEVGNEFVTDADETVDGAPGIRRYEFKAEADGTVAITFTHSRPWEEGSTTSEFTRVYKVESGKITMVSETEAKNPDIVIELSENPESGCEWSYTVSPENALTEVENNVADGETEDDDKIRTFGFDALQDGTVTVTFTYQQAGGDVAKTVVYTYKIENGAATLDTQSSTSNTSAMEALLKVTGVAEKDGAYTVYAKYMEEVDGGLNELSEEKEFSISKDAKIQYSEDFSPATTQITVEELAKVYADNNGFEMLFDAQITNSVITSLDFYYTE